MSSHAELQAVLGHFNTILNDFKKIREFKFHASIEIRCHQTQNCKRKIKYYVFKSVLGNFYTIEISLKNFKRLNFIKLVSVKCHQMQNC